VGNENAISNFRDSRQRHAKINRKALALNHTAASSLTTFDVPSLAGFATLFEQAEIRGSECVLDLADEAIAGNANPSAVRLSIPSVMVLSNLLVGRYREVPLKVRIPESRGLNLQLARGGFFFALANRKGVRWEKEIPEQWGQISEAWTNPFHPNDSQMRRRALVEIKDPEQDSWVIRSAFQRYLLSVMHPHNYYASSLRQELGRIAGRWLSSRMGVKPGSEMVATLTDCFEIFYQIVVNVPDHASLRSNREGCSLGQVYVTLGGGRDSHNRLHFTVLDNGAGLPQRVNELYQDKKRDAEGALRDAVMGNLPRRAAGRGIGLDLVRRIANQYTEGIRGVGGASTICFVTSGDCVGSASWLEWGPGFEEPRMSTVESLPVQGTLGWVSLGLEHRIPDHENAQLELTFDEALAG